MKENKTRISTKKHLKDVKINIIDKNDNCGDIDNFS
jgi:hypothetical protein